MVRRRPGSLRGRVVLGVLALLAVLLSGLFVTVDVILSARLHADLRTRLTDRVALADQLDGALSAQQLVDRLRGDGVSSLLCDADSTSRAGGSANGLTCVRGDSGPAGPAAPPPSRRPGQPPRSGGGPPPRATANSTVQTAGDVLFVRTTLPSTGQVLTLSVDSSQVGSTLRGLVLLEVVGGAVALALAALLLFRVVGIALRPLDDMTALARRIAGGDRGRRLRTGRPDTELGRTAAAFDDMLDELETAVATAAAAEARQRALLGDVSHELRTPLTGLAATTELLLRDEPDRAERENAYVTLVRETHRANRLVDDLLTMARLDTGVPLDTARIDLVDVVEHEVERLRLLAPGLDVTVAAPPAVPVQGDPARLGQVMANLLGNARRAAGATGRVTVDVARCERGWCVDVADSGPGVPSADAERIFERLVRLDASRSRDSGGFGLGLPIARAAARAHHGDLVLAPRRGGEGARFRLTLPAADA
ncbi:Signal transduction histidine kinase [Jatrophihabitans endophyticus]|uniref:histidine kinase n=1 Tax=Jatrophihabitans endophyticus TaxID=1206085 RepID=A0A1M5S675_9ACTN|nr:HAMP domain-containing sensor histidine kinase [Jatrophihabitans endophyticus]SHH33778.1 Signal transduction histidine kinase [Jatrophihabitans endophyticus]